MKKILLFLLGTVSYLFQAFVLVKLGQWFIFPLYHYQILYREALAIILIVSFLKFTVHASDITLALESIENGTANKMLSLNHYIYITGSLMTLCTGFIVKILFF